MPREPDAPEFRCTPIVRLAPRRGQFPLRRPPADPVPGEDQPLELPGRQQVQPGGFGRRGIGRRDALAGCVVLVAWNGQTRRPLRTRPPVSGPRSEPRWGHAAPATQSRPSPSHQATIRRPSQVFPTSFRRSSAARLATKYQPSGNGWSAGAASGSRNSVIVFARFEPYPARVRMGTGLCGGEDESYPRPEQHDASGRSGSIALRAFGPHPSKRERIGPQPEGTKACSGRRAECPSPYRLREIGRPIRDSSMDGPPCWDSDDFDLEISCTLARNPPAECRNSLLIIIKKTSSPL